MKAIVQTKYGSPDLLNLVDVEQPVAPDQGVLVRVHATSVHAGDRHLMRGSPFLIRFMFGGILQPKIKILGTDVAGTVESVGKDVTQFQPGDQVYGDLSECGFGAFAEYVGVPAAALALKPTNSSFEEAATIPVSALAALQGLRDVGQLQPGHKVLINGASGGVGSFAVQIARAFGAEVTALCSTKKMEMVRSIGANQVIDYTQTDVTKNGQQYDLILDMAAYRSVFDYLPILSPRGTYVLVGGSTARLFLGLLFGSWISRISRRQVQCQVSKPNQADLGVLKDLIESGKVKPLIDRHYHLSEVPTAMRRLEQGEVCGKVAISVG
jgi:NADPH:quinone reductase-like Zn-dependent oxidoreductase